MYICCKASYLQSCKMGMDTAAYCLSLGKVIECKMNCTKLIQLFNFFFHLKYSFIYISIYVVQNTMSRTAESVVLNSCH